ncbi:MAG: amidohydrolase [FCB group bacterium]|nr:amidohydrolase [FCB group bacterium]
MKKLTLFFNARIITLDTQQPTADSMLVQDGKILAVGCKLTAAGAEKIDLKQATVVPGLTDAHVHLQGFGRYLEGLQLSNKTSAEQIADLVIEKSGNIPTGEWITGRGWDQSEWTVKKFPISQILNTLVPDHPVMLTRLDGHAVWVNAKAMEVSGFTSASAVPEGGDIVNDCIFIDNAINIIKAAIPDVTDETIERQIKLGADTFVSRGLTCIHDVWQSERIIRLIKKLIDAGEFPLRCYGMLAYNKPPLLENYLKSGHYTSPRLTIRAVKTFIDGAMGSRGAAMLEPYSDEPDNRGLFLMPEEEFEDLAIRCRDGGFQLNTHAIGDRANRLVLDVYSRVLKGVQNHRWRIEHAQMLHDDDIPRFRKEGIMPSMQPTHCTTDMRWLKVAIGEHRTHEISRFKTLIDSGVKIPGGSDCPIETGDPIYEYYSAVTRQDHKGWPDSGWHPEERVDPLDALKMLTTWAAYAGFSEKSQGKLKPGYLADFTVLDRDLVQQSGKAILETVVLKTVVNGEVVYSAD